MTLAANFVKQTVTRASLGQDHLSCPFYHVKSLCTSNMCGWLNYNTLLVREITPKHSKTTVLLKVYQRFSLGGESKHCHLNIWRPVRPAIKEVSTGPLENSLAPALDLWLNSQSADLLWELLSLWWGNSETSVCVCQSIYSMVRYFLISFKKGIPIPSLARPSNHFLSHKYWSHDSKNLITRPWWSTVCHCIFLPHTISKLSNSRVFFFSVIF